MNKNILIEKIPQQKGCRYFIRFGEDIEFSRGFKSKLELQDWINMMIDIYDLDWRVGTLVKLKSMSLSFDFVRRDGISIA